MDFTRLIDLASERLGGAVPYANDEFFAPRENLVRAAPPVWREGEYTERGKWMDGWETRRRRSPGHDWCIIRLGLAGRVHGVVVDTSWFTGNFPETCSIEACSLDDVSDEPKLLQDDVAWTELLPRSALRGNDRNLFEVRHDGRVTHLRLSIFPDGGVARLHVHGTVLPDWRRVLRGGGEVDLAAVEHGGRVVGCSDMHYGSPQNMIMPGQPAGMHDGWETKRRRGPGHDWAIVRLGAPGRVRRIVVDTTHFKGNAPGSCRVEVCESDEETPPADAEWRPLLGETPLLAHTVHDFVDRLADAGRATHVRLSIHPDGGVARFRVFGIAAGLPRLNALPHDEAVAAFAQCCAARDWAGAMAAARPFDDVTALLDSADATWQRLGPAAWRDAFAGHPRIGESRAAAPTGETEQRWSAQEQAGVHDTDDATRRALAEAQREYEARFGHIFLICATGRSAADMLANLRQRLGNDAETELGVAAEEQRKITRLRLEKLLRS